MGLGYPDSFIQIPLLMLGLTVQLSGTTLTGGEDPGQAAPQPVCRDDSDSKKMGRNWHPGGAGFSKACAASVVTGFYVRVVLLECTVE